MTGENLARSIKEAGSDEVEYLKVIFESLTPKKPLLETDNVELDRQFFLDLKDSVDSALSVDSRVNNNIRTKVINAFNLIIDNYATYF